MRDEVKQFAEQMEDRLKDNDWKGGWEDCSPMWLAEKLLNEAIELNTALLEKNTNKIAHETADVANYAMMIADVVSRLEWSVVSRAKQR